MAFPQVQSITQTAFSSDTTSHNVNMPATVNAGDLLLCLFANNGTSTVTTPGGWTQILSTSHASGARLSLYRKTADGTEDGATVDFVTSAAQKASAQVYRITGGSEVEANSDNGSGASPNPLSLSPSWGSDDNLWIAACGNVPIAAGQITGGPTSYTNLTVTESGTDDTAGNTSSARRENATGTQDPATFSASDTVLWVVTTIAIKPAIAKSFSDAGAEGGESFSKVIALTPDFTDAGAEGAEVFAVAKLKVFTDAGPEGSESMRLTKHKVFSDAGPEGSESFSKTRLVNPVYLKDRFEAVLIKIIE